MAPDCSRIFPICVESLEKKKMSTLALANRLWVGKIPDELTYAEQLLIARVCHNRCIVKVSSGMFKMCANAISFSNPMPKIYNVLPPPIEEMDEVLAFILALVKLFYSFNFDPNKNPSRGFVPLGKRSTPTRGKKIQD